MQSADFDYVLPHELIAQQPASLRDRSRLLVLDRITGALTHRTFSDLPALLRPGDLLVLNDSKVIPARLRGALQPAGSELEILLLEENAINDWWVMVRPGKRAPLGAPLRVLTGAAGPSPIDAVVAEINAEGHRRLRFQGTRDIREELASIGRLPLPPYIKRAGAETAADRDRYQTIYAQAPGSVAAPTAGLHFTEEVLARVRQAGVQICFVTLHVGPGTFAPVKSEDLSAHRMHEERFTIGAGCAAAVNCAKQERRRVVVVGTTSLRALESAAATAGALDPTEKGRTRLFVHPPCEFRIADALLTNFHLPRSTLLMLASAFASPGDTRGRDRMLAAYAEAIRARYRFFSYGDAMFIQ